MRFAVLPFSWHPTLNINVTRVGIALVSGARHHHTVRDAERLHKMLMDGYEKILLIKRCLSRREGFHFKLIELMQTQDAFRIFSVRASLTTKRGGEGAVTQRQITLRESLIHLQRR